MFQAIFYLVGTTLNAWLVINEVGKGRDKWSNAWQPDARNAVVC